MAALYLFYGGFQPTPSSRRVTCCVRLLGHVLGISTNTLLAEGDAPLAATVAAANISTNTLLAEGDLNHAGLTPQSSHFNQHPPRGG